MFITKIVTNQKVIEATRGLLIGLCGFITFFLLYNLFAFYEKRGHSPLNDLFSLIILCSVGLTILLLLLFFTYRKVK